MRILVTGGAGFIGSHLCERLVELTHEVACVDSFMTGAKANISHLLGKPNFKLIEHDIRNTLPSGAYDFIFHLASPASPVDYAALPIETLLTNSVGCRNVLDIAAENKCGIFIASTSEVYGDPLVTPQTEQYWGNVNPIGVRSCYDEGKRFAEALAVAYERKTDLVLVIGRIFNTFGPRMRINDGRAIPNFINQALTDEPLTVYGDGSQTRSFCYVDDLIHAFELILEKVTSGLKDDGSVKVVNLGNSAEMTILDLAQTIKTMCQSASEIVYGPLPGDDPLQRRPELAHARSWLKYEPKVSLKEGLDKVITWFAEARKLEKRISSGEQI